MNIKLIKGAGALDPVLFASMLLAVAGRKSILDGNRRQRNDYRPRDGSVLAAAQAKRERRRARAQGSAS